jgi:hypothetical protein
MNMAGPDAVRGLDSLQIPDEDIGRQAVSSLRGYVYQVYRLSMRGSGYEKMSPSARSRGGFRRSCQHSYAISQGHGRLRICHTRQSRVGSYQCSLAVPECQHG